MDRKDISREERTDNKEQDSVLIDTGNITTMPASQTLKSHLLSVTFTDELLRLTLILSSPLHIQIIIIQGASPVHPLLRDDTMYAKAYSHSQRTTTG